MMNRAFWILAFHLCPSHLVTLGTEDEEVLSFLDIIWLSVLPEPLVSPLRAEHPQQPLREPGFLSVMEFNVNAPSGTGCSVLGHTSPVIILA